MAPYSHWHISGTEVHTTQRNKWEIAQLLRTWILFHSVSDTMPKTTLCWTY